MRPVVTRNYSLLVVIVAGKVPQCCYFAPHGQELMILSCVRFERSLVLRGQARVTDISARDNSILGRIREAGGRGQLENTMASADAHYLFSNPTSDLLIYHIALRTPL